MQGYHVRRKAGWDTHGLPVEIAVEKEFKFLSKKDIEEYGVAKFNEKCKERVLKYIDEWGRFTERMGYWVDQKNAYFTYTPEYIESLWWIIKQIHNKGLLYKDYKVLPWCPRCGTALSSHELALGYEQVKDLSLYVKFEVVGEKDTYFLAWTTTPWTLLGNVALAINPETSYVKAEKGGVSYILAEKRVDVLGGEYKILRSITGKDLIGKSYKPIFDFLGKEKNEDTWKVYGAPFVTTEEGTGIVHVAVMYGQDDFLLGKKVGLPKKHLVGEDGKFLLETGEFAGKFVKDEETEVSIIKYLAGKGLLFKKEKHEHTYPFCWRCKTPLIYYARDSWYIKMSALRDTLIAENKTINWEPEHIRDGRFGEWLREVKDWAISRERYWGTPLPLWEASDGTREVIGSIEELKAVSVPRNRYYTMRHGEADSNILGIVSGKKEHPHHLTEKGKNEVRAAILKLKKAGIDFIVSSPFVRTRETAEIVCGELNLQSEALIFDDRLGELYTGVFDQKPIEEYHNYYTSRLERFEKPPKDGETLVHVKKRMGDAIYSLEEKYKGKTILIVSHEYPLWMLESVACGFTPAQAVRAREEEKVFWATGEVKELTFKPLPHNENYELDLHKPYIDEFTFEKNGKTFRRVPEVMDVWFDSGAMPFAQDHYPFEKTGFQPEKGFLKRQYGYPADYISEAIDQTRGWFYTLHAIGVLLGYGKAYKNVICLGHILDEKGKKMSKSVGNVVDPWSAMDTYGADVLRFWMYTVNQPGESKNFDEKTVTEVGRKTLNLLTNILLFYTTYTSGASTKNPNSPHILDRWIVSYFNEINNEVTKAIDEYKILEAGRILRDFIGELSQWYLRRSRDRIRGGNKEDARYAGETLGFILVEFSKLTAPFMPFVSEEIYREVTEGKNKESVHLENWPEGGAPDTHIIENMKRVRAIVETALSLRSKKGIKVRQPLQSISIKEDIADEYKVLICDEVNVKEVIYNASLQESVMLNTEITSELKTEGQIRDIIRSIQDLRKEKSFKPGERANLFARADGEARDIFDTHAEKIKKSATLDEIRFADNVSGEEIIDGDIRYTLEIRK